MWKGKISEGKESRKKMKSGIEDEGKTNGKHLTKYKQMNFALFINYCSSVFVQRSSTYLKVKQWRKKVSTASNETIQLE